MVEKERKRLSRPLTQEQQQAVSARLKRSPLLVQKHVVKGLSFGAIPKEAMRHWLSSPNRYLGGLTPRDALVVGRFERVEAALEALDSGIFI